MSIAVIYTRVSSKAQVKRVMVWAPRNGGAVNLPPIRTTKLQKSLEMKAFQAGWLTVPA